MADNITARDGSGTLQTLATKQLVGGQHVTKHTVVDQSGNAIDFASGAKQDALAALVALIGTRTYDWANIDTVAIGASSAVSSAVGTAGEYELSADTDCYVVIGSAPTATTSSRYLPAGSAWTVQLSATDKVAVIRKDFDGTLTILPVA